MNNNQNPYSHARFTVAVMLSAFFIGMPGAYFLHRSLRPYWRFGYTEVKRDNIQANYSYETRVIYSNGIDESLLNESNKRYHFWLGPMFMGITFFAVLIEYIFIKLLLGFSIFNDHKP